MDQKRYIDFKDMFDGGGAGQMGDTFQGGGLFSLIANMVADPYGSKDPERRKERMKALGLLDTGMDMSTPPAAPVVEPKQMSTPPLRGPAGMTAPMTVPPMSGPAGMPTPPASGFMDIVRSAGSLSGPAGMPGAPKEPSLIAAEQLASELGNAWYMMPQQEQIMRINQRVQQMQGM